MAVEVAGGLPLEDALLKVVRDGEWVPAREGLAGWEGAADCVAVPLALEGLLGCGAGEGGAEALSAALGVEEGEAEAQGVRAGEELGALEAVAAGALGEGGAQGLAEGQGEGEGEPLPPWREGEGCEEGELEGEAGALAQGEGEAWALAVGALEAEGAAGLAEGEALGLGEAEDQGEGVDRVLEVGLPPACVGESRVLGEGEGQGEALTLVQADTLGDTDKVALGVGSSEALLQALGMALALGVAERQREAEAVGEGRCEGKGAALPLGDRLGSCTSPAALQADCARWAALQGMGAAVPALGQKLPAGHVTQVALEVAPVAALAVPAGHGTASIKRGGQKCPGGQIKGTPEVQ